MKLSLVRYSGLSKFRTLVMAIMILISQSGFVNLHFIANDLSNPFDSCQCTSLAYEAAPDSIQHLIKWTQGTKFDNYPKNPDWVSWNAGLWASNILTFGPKMDAKLDWVSAVNNTPSVGSIVVYLGNTTTTSIKNNQKNSFTFSSAGHVAVVTSYDSKNNTINTSDKNWVVCGPVFRENVDVTNDMIFIHDPKPIVNNDNSQQEIVMEYKAEFYSKLPWRNIWLSSASKFELYLDGKLVMSSNRPLNWSSFSKQKISLKPFSNHQVLIKWWKTNSDPEPQFNQTWWPNVIVSAAEPDPNSALNVAYVTYLDRDVVKKGEDVSLAIYASSDTLYQIESIDVFLEKNKIGTIHGSSGTININTSMFPGGLQKLHLISSIPDWAGSVSDYFVTINVLDVNSSDFMAVLPDSITPSSEQPQSSIQLEAPILSSPKNDSLFDQEEKVTLSWNSSFDASKYQVELWGGAYSTMVPCSWQSSTSCNIGQLWPGIMYWHVKARNSSGSESEWSPTWTFKIKESNLPLVDPTALPIPDSLNIPVLTFPSNGENYSQATDVSLSWTSSSNAVQYKVELWGGPYSLMVPCDWQSGTTCHIGQMWPGNMSWHVKARNSSGQESDWSSIWSFTIDQPSQEAPTSVPMLQEGYLELVDDLTLRTESGNWPTQAGQKIIAHIRIRNGGDLLLHIQHLGVRGRRNGSDSWDIGFWTVDLNGRQEWSLDPNNERPLEPGNYSFKISYSLDGSNWTEIGSEINFNVP